MSNEKNNKIYSFLENFILIAIILVIIQTFLEDFSIYNNFNPETIKLIKISGFFFDLLFSIEFIVRLISSSREKKIVQYFIYRNGWIDLLSSIPLLLLVSGPFFLHEVAGINIANLAIFNLVGMTKLIKAIRVTRILRLLRIIKIFGKIKNTESIMAQRNVTTVLTLVIFSLILFLMFIASLQELKVLPSKYNDLVQIEDSIISNYSIQAHYLTQDEFENVIKESARSFPNIYKITYKNKLLYKYKYISFEYLEQLKKKNDHSIIERKALNDELSIIFSREELEKSSSFNNLINFFLIIFIIIVIITFYTRYFALTTTDPIYVMRQGFEKMDYTLAVKIPEYYEEDDIFKLANDYNNRWLPAKLRKLNEIKTQTSKLSFNDIFKK